MVMKKNNRRGLRRDSRLTGQEGVAAPMSHHAEVVETVCANCGAELGGGFCHACGQKAAGPDVSLRHFFHEAFEEFAHVDGKIVRTLRPLLTKPGTLTKEFLDGRRARYISPIRLYLTCSVLFFALAAIAPPAERPFFHVSRVAGEAGLDPVAVQQLRDAATLRANQAIVHDLPRAMFALMPAFGLLTWVLYRKKRPFYAAHLYYSIHLHAFIFLALTVAIPLRLVGGPATGALSMVAIFVYLYASLRRVFGGSRLQTAWKGALIGISYSAMVLAAVLAIGLWSMRTSTLLSGRHIGFELRYARGGARHERPQHLRLYEATGLWPSG